MTAIIIRNKKCEGYKWNKEGGKLLIYFLQNQAIIKYRAKADMHFCLLFRDFILFLPPCLLRYLLP
jgi:hypothetical protein